MLDRLIIATRESPLALWQANFVKAELEARHEGLAVELLGMRTQGDRWLQSPLSEIGGKGLFIKELEQGLLPVFQERVWAEPSLQKQKQPLSSLQPKESSSSCDFTSFLFGLL